MYIDAYIQENYAGYKDMCYTGYIDLAIHACYTNYLMPLYLHISGSTYKNEVPVHSIKAYG